MLISRQHQILLRDSLREKPLGENEVRHIDWMGEQYLAREGAIKSPDIAIFTQLYTLRIDGAKYIIYAKLPHQSSQVLS